MDITEKEYAVIREISINHLPGQRTIATRAGISLGLTNIIIKRLINKGYVKAKLLNRKKIQYMLTPKGFTEKTRKSYHYTLQTINNIKNLKEILRNAIMQKYNEGAFSFCVSGNNEELCYLTEMVFRDSNLAGATYSVEIIRNGSQHILELKYRTKNSSEERHINLIEYLVDAGILE